MQFENIGDSVVFDLPGSEPGTFLLGVARVIAGAVEADDDIFPRGFFLHELFPLNVRRGILKSSIGMSGRY